MLDEREKFDRSRDVPDGGEERVPSRRFKWLALIAIAASLWIISSLGCMPLFLGWRGESPSLAVVRCVGFVVLIIGVHRIGYGLWRAHCEQGQDDGIRVLSRPISSVYWPPMRTALLQQNITIILAALVLDQGQAISMATIAIVAYWLAFGVLVFRRPRSPTEGDTSLIRYGFLLILAAIILVGPRIGECLDRYP